MHILEICMQPYMHATTHTKINQKYKRKSRKSVTYRLSDHNTVQTQNNKTRNELDACVNVYLTFRRHASYLDEFVLQVAHRHATLSDAATAYNAQRDAMVVSLPIHVERQSVADRHGTGKTYTANRRVNEKTRERSSSTRTVTREGEYDVCGGKQLGLIETRPLSGYFSTVMYTKIGVCGDVMSIGAYRHQLTNQSKYKLRVVCQSVFLSTSAATVCSLGDQ